MDNCVLKPVWSTLKPVILAKFLTGANKVVYRERTRRVCRRLLSHLLPARGLFLGSLR
jgi:hypothetical protein